MRLYDTKTININIIFLQKQQYYPKPLTDEKSPYNFHPDTTSEPRESSGSPGGGSGGEGRLDPLLNRENLILSLRGPYVRIFISRLLTYNGWERYTKQGRAYISAVGGKARRHSEKMRMPI